MSMIFVWAVLACLFLAVEIATVAMVSIWFIIGALAGLLAAALHAAVWLQIVLFVLVSLVCFLVLYPLVKRFVHKSMEATNADTLLGRTCVVTRSIDNVAGVGAVRIDGKTWTARTSNGETAAEGTLVKIDAIQGVKLLVSPVPNQS